MEDNNKRISFIKNIKVNHFVCFPHIKVNDNRFTNDTDNDKIDIDASNNFNMDCGVESTKIEVKEKENAK